MKRPPLHAARQRGFTLIELLIVLALTAILLVVAVGGFGTSFSRKRVEEQASHLVTDLQEARSLAVSNNVPVRLTFGTGCHVLHTVGTTDTICTGTTATPGTGARIFRHVQRAANDTTFAALPANDPPTFIGFNNRNGTTNTDGGADPGALIGSTAGNWQLRVRVNAMGRVEICSPSSTVSGYIAC